MNNEKIRDYNIEGLLGRGGMGSVYLATHVHLKKKAALKVLLEQFSANAEIKTRFVNEASLLHDLQHKNIVQQREFFEENGRLVLVMEYVDGRALDKMIGQDVGPIPWVKALPLFTQILDGIGYAHSKGIVHRDIKPANILISKEGQVKVTDLGIAKIAGEKGMTRTGAQMGTLYYESPEQIRGAKDVDYRSDIYSLGMTLYEMLAGRLPFDKGGDTSEFEIMSAVVHRQNNLDPRDHYPHIPEWLVETIQTATDLTPGKRYQSCEHFKQVIEKYGKLSVTESTFWSGKVASISSSPVTKIKSISKSSSSPAHNSVQCPECGVDIDKTMKFCDNCGKVLEKDCPKCHGKIRWNRSFCPQCGYNSAAEPENQIHVKQPAERQKTKHQNQHDTISDKQFKRFSSKIKKLKIATFVFLGLSIISSILYIPVLFYIFFAGFLFTSHSLLFQFWKTIQDGNPRTSPGKAVGYLFIPFFNLYWAYVAIRGLAKDMNDYCDANNISGLRVNEKLVLLIYIPYIVSNWITLALIIYSF